MTTTGNGKGLMMTYLHKVYSFHCDTPSTCYWIEEEAKLKIERRDHLMFTVPASLVDSCDCPLNSECYETSGCSCNEEGGQCDEQSGQCICKKGFWGEKCNLDCNCHENGSVGITCDQINGQCTCKEYFSGRKCNYDDREYDPRGGL